MISSPGRACDAHGSRTNISIPPQIPHYVQFQAKCDSRERRVGQVRPILRHILSSRATVTHSHPRGRYDPSSTVNAMLNPDAPTCLAEGGASNCCNQDLFRKLGIVTSVLYTGEILLRLIAVGWRRFLTNRLYVFDAIVVLSIAIGQLWRATSSENCALLERSCMCPFPAERPGLGSGS